MFFLETENARRIVFFSPIPRKPNFLSQQMLHGLGVRRGGLIIQEKWRCPT